MSRAPARDESDSFSLFPFLAVLLCTMGALLILLVGLAKAARNRVAEQREAIEQAAAAKATIAPELAQQLGEIEQYVAQLETVRKTAAKRLQEDKARLSHLEDHMRRLKDELGNLQIAAMELEAMNSEHDDDRAQAESELKRLKGLISAAEKRIEELKEEQRGKGKSYAIVPYAGRNGTLRPTIYIECRKDRVILQPEGVELKPSDFRPPLGAGNPLAAALRSAREYLARRLPVEPGGVPVEPYPLILVRPDGVAAYYKVRDAIRGWEADFGYELVGADWNLTFPSPNPELTRCELLAIEDARARRRLLAQAAPSAYGGDDGEFEIDDGADEAGEMGLADGSSEAGPGTAVGTVKSAVLGGVEAGMHGGFADGGNPDLAELGTTESTGSGPSNFEVTAGSGGSGDSTAAAHDSERDSLDESQTAESTGAGESENTPSNPGDEVFGQSGSSPRTAPQGLTAATEETGPNVTGNGSMTSGSATVNAAQPMGAAGSEASDAAAQAEFTPQPAPVRGKDWAIRDAAPASVAIRRTVQIVVRSEQLAILPDRAQTAQLIQEPDGKTIGLESGQAIPVETFVSSLWKHMDQWGMAGNGLYWKPVLVLNVAPGGEQRAAELTQLLRSSGAEVRTRDTAQRTKQTNHATTK